MLSQALRRGARFPRPFTVGQTSSFSSKPNEQLKEKNRRIAYYFATLAIATIGASYAAVPLYKVFCQMTGFGGTTQRADEARALSVKPVDGGRIVRVNFAASVHDTMPWKFKATQTDVRVVPGETALAFFTAKNPTDTAISGVATYNVYPPKAGIYFNKIQCFCFEEQRLGSKEEVDMPVFFFIDPEFLTDPAMGGVNNITLSYTFFKTGEDKDDDEVVVPALAKPSSTSAGKIVATSSSPPSPPPKAVSTAAASA